MPDASNERLVRRLYDDYLNPGRLDRLDEIVSPDFDGPAGRGVAGFTASMAALRAGFPDLAYAIEDVVAGGDRVAVRWVWRGTHTGPFRSLAPTGKKVVSAGMAIFQITGGKLGRAWLETDRLGFLQALGAIPYDPAYGPSPAAPK